MAKKKNSYKMTNSIDLAQYFSLQILFRNQLLTSFSNKVFLKIKSLKKKKKKY